MFTQNKDMGQFSTPKETVNYMVQYALELWKNPEQPPFVLDPCTGDGIFITSLLETGIPPSYLTAYDMDPLIQSPHEEISYAHQDFLKVPSKPQFDIIIGNPPYKSKRESQYFREHHDWMKEEFSSIGTHNLYTLFIYKGIQLLNQNGILSMIVQDSYLTNVYYKKFREYLLKHSEIEEILLAPRRLFHKGKADVRTSILTLRKKKPVTATHQIRLVDRLVDQNYTHPPFNKVQYVAQKVFEALPNFNFAINVPKEVLSLFHQGYTPLGDRVKVATGISTGNDKAYIQTAAQMTGNEEGWVPFYKNGGAKDSWYYPPKYYIEDQWEVHARKSSSYSVRNTGYFYKEGITCSSMGAAFSASYLPEGCLFGVNANLFPSNRQDLYYVLGLLNSNLIKYILRKVLNRTNMLTAGYVKKIPYIDAPKENKDKLAVISKEIVDYKLRDSSYDPSPHLNEVNQLAYQIYGISEDSQALIEEFCENIVENL